MFFIYGTRRSLVLSTEENIDDMDMKSTKSSTRADSFSILKSLSISRGPSRHGTVINEG